MHAVAQSTAKMQKCRVQCFTARNKTGITSLFDDWIHSIGQQQPAPPSYLFPCYIFNHTKPPASLSGKILMITCARGLLHATGSARSLARSPPACTALFGCAHHICDMYLWVNPPTACMHGCMMLDMAEG
jgi:hypothetical protein